MFRAIALSLALLIGAGTIIPLMTDYSHAESSRFAKKTKKKKIKKYSRVWWKRYYARQKRKKAAIAYRRALRARQILLARKNKAAAYSAQTVAGAEKKVARDSSPATLPSGETAPQSWQKGLASTSELQYQINDAGGNSLGAAAITVVGAATGPDSDDFRNRAVGGVSTSSLRRIVIDKMMREEGWVVNDLHKTINGRKVYVVVAQSTVKGVVQSRMFYFTEVGGRIYNLATSAPESARERLAEESERVLKSLQRDKNSTKAELK